MGQPLPLGGGDHHLQTAITAVSRHGSRHLLFDHLPGDMVDGGSPHGLVQTGPGDPAHPFPAVNGNTLGGAPLHPGEDEGAVGGVGVVSPVLPDGAGGPIRAGGRLQQLDLHRNARRGVDTHRRRELAAEEELRRPSGCRRRAGTGGIAAPKPLPPHGDIVFEIAQIIHLPGLLRHKTDPLLYGKGPSTALVWSSPPKSNTIAPHGRSPGSRFLLRRPFSAPWANGWFTPSSALTVEVRLRRICTGLPFSAAASLHLCG